MSHLKCDSRLVLSPAYCLTLCLSLCPLLVFYSLSQNNHTHKYSDTRTPTYLNIHTRAHVQADKQSLIHPVNQSHYHSFTHSVTHSVFHSRTYKLTHSFTGTHSNTLCFPQESIAHPHLTLLFTHSLNPALIQTRFVTPSPIHTSHSIVYSLAHSNIHSLKHFLSHIHPFTHLTLLFTHSLTRTYAHSNTFFSHSHPFAIHVISFTFPSTHSPSSSLLHSNTLKHPFLLCYHSRKPSPTHSLETNNFACG